VELAFWETVKDSDNPAMYEAYLEKYSEGAFAALAKARLDELRP
jgi:adenylate cyclase